jgi:hypothetical protein
MGMMIKLRTLLTLDFKTMLLFTEALIYMGYTRFLLRYRPFSKVAPSLGAQMQETTDIWIDRNNDSLQKVHDAIRIMSNHTFWESKCLVKAIAALKMLERRQIESTLYLGTAKDEFGKMVAHAWLRSGPFYITGAEVMEQFIVVGKFAKRINLKGKQRE